MHFQLDQLYSFTKLRTQLATGKQFVHLSPGVALKLDKDQYFHYIQRIRRIIRFMYNDYPCGFGSVL